MNTLESLRTLSDDELTEIARAVTLKIIENPSLIDGGKIDVKGVPCHIENHCRREYGELIFVIVTDKENADICALWDFSKGDPEECRELLAEGLQYCIGEVSNCFDDNNTTGWIDNKTARLLQAALNL